MKKRKVLFIFGLIVLVCTCFTTCQNPSFENPIIEKWWVAEEDQEYKAIMKNIPLYVYETILETEYIYEKVFEYITINNPQVIVVEKPLPPDVMLQYINIISIEFIIFSGNQTEYNVKSEVVRGTDLTEQEQKTNNKIVTEMEHELENPDYFLILLGHANPVYGTDAEIAELTQISTDRATDVRDAIAWVHDGKSLPAVSNPPPSSNSIGVMDPNHEYAKRISTKGYGGGRNISSSSSSYAGLNRRVEVILFTIDTVVTVKDGVGGS